MEFRWIPGKGIDMDAVERMKQHFPMPSEPPRMAWFMDPRNQDYFPGLLDAITGASDISYIERFLFDTGGGIKNFGRYEEWVVWFQCLLPHLFLHILEGELLPLTLTYFLNVYPDSIPAEYAGFREDVLKTLPHSIMENMLWDGRDLAKEHWWFDEWAGYWSASLHATMFFCLKYLTSAEIPEWVASIAKIDGQLWRQHIIQWLNGASKFFGYFEHPETQPDTKVIKKASNINGVEVFLEAAGINWYPSFLVFSGQNPSRNLWDYLSKENVDAFWREVKKYPQLSFSDANTN